MSFQCRQFYLKDDRCAMKVSTDSLLFGAWIELPAPVNKVRRVLDMGCGCGILALMLAQRLAATAQSFAIDALELDSQAATQAHENTDNSPWAEHIQIHHQAVEDWQPPHAYDLIVANPPYFPMQLRSSDSARAMARQGKSTAAQLWLQWSKLAQSWLHSDGRLALVLPVTAQLEQHYELWQQQGWVVSRQCMVRSTVNKPPKLVLLELSQAKHFTGSGRPKEQLTIHTAETTSNSSEGYSEAFRQLTADFYLAGSRWR